MAKDDSGFAEIEDYTRKLAQNPESLVFVPLAEAYRKNGMLDEAIETCLKGLQVHPSYMSARMVLGRTYMEKQMFDEAAVEFLKVSAADVNNIMAHSLLGQINVKQGKFTNAIEEYQKVLTLNPDDTHAQQMLKQALELAKQNGIPRPETPSGASSTASENKDKDNRKELSQAEAFTKQGDVENALKIYRLILEADPENLVVRQRLKDLELRKAQAQTGAERKPGDRSKPEAANAGYRENDKITSDDILSVMKDTVPKAPDKAKAESKPEPAKVEAKAKAHVEISSSALAKLSQIEGIVGTLLIDDKGGILDTTFLDQGNLKDMAQTAVLIFEKTGKAVDAMNYGKQVKQILITGEKGQIFFNKSGSRILLVQADENINIGKLRMAINDVNKP